MSHFHLSTGAQILSPSTTGTALTVNATGGGGTLQLSNQTGNALFVDSKGNIGIGTGAPMAKLDIAGNINLTGAIYKNNLIMHSQIESTINLSSQNNTIFYPVALLNAPIGYTHYFSIEMPDQVDAAAYNMHSLHAVVRGGGWSDQEGKVEVFHNLYNANERSILGIYRGQQSFYNIVVYLRGGQTYSILTNSRSVIAYTSVVTLDTSVFALKNVSGADVSGTSAFITQIWSGMGPEGKNYSHMVYSPKAMFIAKMTANSGAATTSITVPFNTLETNTENVFNTGTYYFTAPVRGYYMLGYNIALNTTSGFFRGNTSCGITTSTSGAVAITNWNFQSVNGTDRWYFTGNTLVFMNADDYAYVYAMTGNTTTTGSGVYVDKTGSSFFGYLVNPL